MESNEIYQCPKTAVIIQPNIHYQISEPYLDPTHLAFWAVTVSLLSTFNLKLFYIGTEMPMSINDESASSFKFDNESSLIMDMILEDDEQVYSSNYELPSKFAEYIGTNILQKPAFAAEKFGMKTHYMKPQNSGSGTINWGPPPPPS